MIPKTSYRRRLFIYFVMVFIVFTSIITSIQYKREKDFKARELKAVLDTYSDVINAYILSNSIGVEKDFSSLDSLNSIVKRKDLRITIVALNGKVLYDNFFANYSEMVNHISRPEIQQAQQSLFDKIGYSIRLSSTTNQDYFYYAKKYDKYFIRTALVYSVGIQEFLKVESMFWYIIAILFLIATSIFFYISDTVGKSILKLKDFAVMAANNESFIEPVNFPDNELGEIGNQIANIYDNLHKANKQLMTEKDRLFNHIQISKEGIAIYSKSHKQLLVNNIFIQHLNLISDKNSTNPEDVIKLPEFTEIKEFVRSYSSDSTLTAAKVLPIKRIDISKNMRHFEIQCIIFHDYSYEISINDITQNVKQKRLKQEMTSNIAHELRTPVSSIKGYLETILTGNDIDPEKQKYFIEKASFQIDRLSELIRDISVLNKIEESAELYDKEELFLERIVKEVVENMNAQIKSVNAKVECNINKDTKVNGNRALIFSIFQNLIENSLNYGGSGIAIFIDECRDDDDRVFVSFSDNGVGIAEEHHARIFERFYRIDKGRSRGTGGTGLGLAIVKNAIELHGNTIMVKNREGGGAEFLFSFNRAS